MRQNIVVLSDLQVGSTVALWPKDGCAIEGGGLYMPNICQAWLADCWADMLERVSALRPKPTLVLNGDMMQGVNSRDGQIIGATVQAQMEAAYRLLEPLKRISKAIYVIRGSEFHDGKAGESVEGLAGRLGAVPDADTGQSSVWELYYRADGSVINFAHHVGVSSVPWYEATVPLRDALMQLAELARMYGTDAPQVRLVVRSHRHRYIHVDTGDMQVVVTPGWQLRTAYAYRRGGVQLPHIGWLLITVEDGELWVRPRRYRLPALRIEGGI